MKTPIAVFIYNPRLLRTLLNIAENYDLRFYVPEDLTSINGELLVDTEGLEVLRRIVDIKDVKYYLVSDESSIYRFIIKAFGIKEVKVLQVGMDLGGKLAYVIVCDNLLLKAGYMSRLEDLLSIIKDFRKYLTPNKVVVKLGNSPRSTRWDLDRVIDDLIRSGFEVVIIDESNSSSKTQVRLCGFKTRFTTDIYAALNIVFRDGVRVSTT